MTLVILLIAGLVRVPLLWRGFGGHPDEWYLIRSGLDFWLHGVYHPSRPAGFPLNEIMMAGLAWFGGAPACAAAATAASLGALAYMRRLAPLHGIADSFWPVLAFSFEPWFWSSGTHDLDYVWGVLSLVAALYYIERRRFGTAGVVSGLGFGFRPTSLLWIAPLFRVTSVDRRWQGPLRFGLCVAITGLVPASMILWWIIASKSEAFGGISWQLSAITQAAQFPLAAPALAAYHLVELMGHLPAVLLITAACYVNRGRLRSLFRRREGWVWTYVLIFAFLLLPFSSLSEKPEHMLPALPGLFMILGRCLSNAWWRAITAAFIFNAFVSFGFGHGGHAGTLSIDWAPSPRPGVLLWYAERAKGANDFVARVGSELSEPSRIIHAGDRSTHLDPFYVSALLTRGPSSQARISCPLIPARLSSRADAPLEITRSRGLAGPAPAQYPLLVCCASNSAVVSSVLPASWEEELKAAIPRLCASGQRPGTD